MDLLWGPVYLHWAVGVLLLFALSENVSEPAGIMNFCPCEDKSLQTCRPVGVGCRELKSLSTGHSLLALFAVYLYILGDFFQIQCGTDGEVPTASHFHKQMSENHKTPSSPLTPCTHTHTHTQHFSRLLSHLLLQVQNVWAFHLRSELLSGRTYWILKQFFHLSTTILSLILVSIQFQCSHSCLHVLHTGYGCGERPGDRADDRYGGARHGQLRPSLEECQKAQIFTQTPGTSS